MSLHRGILPLHSTVSTCIKDRLKEREAGEHARRFHEELRLLYLVAYDVSAHVEVTRHVILQKLLDDRIKLWRGEKRS